MVQENQDGLGKSTIYDEPESRVKANLVIVWIENESMEDTEGLEIPDFFSIYV